MSLSPATAVTVVPQNIEKLPLYHWRPGARLLAVGSRDGASFAGDPQADRNTFQRPLSVELLRTAVAKQRLDGLALSWAATLQQPAGVAVALAAEPAALVVATPAIGDPELLERLLPVVDAWLLLVTSVDPAPLAARILAAGRHVEVVIGLVDERVPAHDWSRAAALHLCARRPAEADNLDAWALAARAQLPATAFVYDDHHQHTACPACGERLIWRHSGRSRIDAQRVPGGLACNGCQTVVAVVP
jgi:hypothetical protein